MYIIYIMTPANDNPNKMVKTYYVGQVQYAEVILNDWDEDINFAQVFTDKLEAKKVRSYLRTLKGSEQAKISLRNLFSKN